MRNFDDSRKKSRASEEARTFVLGGETFVLRPAIHPEALEDYDRITPESTIKETLDIVDELILNMIDTRDDSHERYHRVRSNRNDPITIDDLQELVQWMVEMQTARPTGQPGDSSPGQSSTATESTVESSSPVAEALTV